MLIYEIGTCISHKCTDTSNTFLGKLQNILYNIYIQLYFII